MPPPVWQPLPRHAVLRGKPNALLSTAASTRLENPAVNPMIAHGRTAADAQADLNNFRHQARQQAAATE
eukprot:3652275-Pleurochrysis_carterae.AAC.1